jgi:hypothetical protein
VSYPLGLYSTGMHDWILDEALLGQRVAHGLDGENNAGWSALMDLSYAEYVRDATSTPNSTRIE